MKHITPKYLDSMFDHVITPIYNHLKAMLDRGYKVHFSFDELVGSAQKGATKFKFSTGSENLYIEYESHTKGSTSAVLNQLEALDNVMQNDNDQIQFLAVGRASEGESQTHLVYADSLDQAAEKAADIILQCQSPTYSGDIYVDLVTNNVTSHASNYTYKAKELPSFNITGN